MAAFSFPKYQSFFRSASDVSPQLLLPMATTKTSPCALTDVHPFSIPISLWLLVTGLLLNLLTDSRVWAGKMLKEKSTSSVRWN